VSRELVGQEPELSVPYELFWRILWQTNCVGKFRYLQMVEYPTVNSGESGFGSPEKITYFPALQQDRNPEPFY
jgi:hypothetical protein